MRPTLVFQGQTVAPAIFEQRVLRSAAALQAAGVGSGDVVALMMHNSPEALELTVATRRLGAQWCPINWHYKTDEVQYILSDCSARIFVADASLLAGLPGLQPGATRVYSARGQAAGPLAWEAVRDATAPISTDPAAPRGPMLYTSGTTGRPKGIVRAPSTPEQALRAAEVRNLAYGFGPGMRALINAPMYHSAPNSYAVGVAQEGGTLYMEDRFDAERTLALIAEHRLTHAYLVPTMYVRMLALPAAVRSTYDLRSMQFVASPAAPVRPRSSAR